MLKFVWNSVPEILPKFKRDSDTERYFEEQNEKIVCNLKILEKVMIIFCILGLIFSGLSEGLMPKLWVFIVLTIFLDSIYIGLSYAAKTITAKIKTLDKKVKSLKYLSWVIGLHSIPVFISMILILPLFTLPFHKLVQTKCYSLTAIMSMFQLCINLSITRMWLAVLLVGIFQISCVILPFDRVDWPPIIVGTLFVNLVSLTLWVILERHNRVNFLIRMNLEEDQKFYLDFFDRLPNPSIILDNLRIMHLNEAARCFGVSDQTLSQITTTMYCSEGKTLSEYIRKASTSTSNVRFQKEFQKNNQQGSNKFVVSIFHSRLLAHANAIIVVFHDITDTIQLQQQKIEERYHKMLLLSLSHELRTPLNGVTGIIDYLKSFPETKEPKYVPYLKKAKHNCRLTKNSESSFL